MLFECHTFIYRYSILVNYPSYSVEIEEGVVFVLVKLGQGKCCKLYLVLLEGEGHKILPTIKQPPPVRCNVSNRAT